MLSSDREPSRLDARERERAERELLDELDRVNDGRIDDAMRCTRPGGESGAGDIGGKEGLDGVIDRTEDAEDAVAEVSSEADEDRTGCALISRMNMPRIYELKGRASIRIEAKD